MKASTYNCRVKTADGEYLLNTYSLNHIGLDDNVEAVLSGASEDWDTIARLVSQGFLVPDDFDEASNVEDMFLKKRLQRDFYSLTVNTTLDCNLRCSYCYESHVRGSRISDDLIESIGRHLLVKHAADKFKNLSLTLFGGEPLLNKDVVRKLVDVVDEASAQCGFDVAYHVVTNATLVDADYVQLFKSRKASFQVTLDGVGGGSDGGRKGAFDRIVSALRTLNDAGCFSVNLRINYNADSICEIEKLLPHVDFLNRRRTSVSLCKIWQADSESITKESVSKAVKAFNDCGFVVGSFLPAITYQHCYADNYSQAVVNCDGCIFKCTARDFSDDGSCGNITEFGFINWKIDRVLERIGLVFPQCCHGCKIMPFCPGICSQSLLDARKEGRQPECKRTRLFSVDELVAIGFRQILLRQHNESVY